MPGPLNLGLWTHIPGPKKQEASKQIMASEEEEASSKLDSKWPRKYERVPGLDEIDSTDFVALAKARDQWVRDR